MNAEREVALKAIEVAQTNLDGAMRTSAELCLADARRMLDDGLYFHALSRSVASLRYSVGIFHPACREMSSLLDSLRS